MFFIIYISSADKPFTKPELLSLLDKCHENNAKLEITGMLLYKDGNFMQVLEGEEETVRNLYNKITGDSRHHGAINLLQGNQPERQFPEWSMGFRDLNSPETLAAPGYSEFMNYKLTGEEFSADPTRAQKLLLSFKKNM